MEVVMKLLAVRQATLSDLDALIPTDGSLGCYGCSPH